ncbi:hypothetical protein KKF84_01940 [Myxococcota bacterium]|nr:hypothetical protein [Myxococcota bacterium]MBU1534047.1 hypothetical protein [Myxococcota bacterium]
MTRFSLCLIITLVVGCQNVTDSHKNECGNGVIEPGEECEGTIPASLSCSQLNPLFPKGEITCSDSCQFDLSRCEPPVCGDGIRHSGEFCDGLDLGGETCTSIGFFNEGELRCDANCRFDTSACSFACNVQENFSPCDPFAGVDECCPKNGQLSTCSASYGDGSARCLQLCYEPGQCGWSLQCNLEEHVCNYLTCGENSMGGGYINSGCLLNGSESGWCYPFGTAMDAVGICLQSGEAQHGEPCTISPAIDGSLNIDPATQCKNGECRGRSFSGHCISYCNPQTAITESDTCPANFNCLDFSDLNMEQFTTTGEMNPDFLFRTASYGLCYPMVDDIIPAIDQGLVTCNLISGNRIKSGDPCPTNSGCKPLFLGSLMGYCKGVATSLLPPGTLCNPPNPGSTGICQESSSCFMADPFNDPSPIDPQWRCRSMCDARLGMTSNPSCTGQTTMDGTPFICLTVSRFYTPDKELPTDTSSIPTVTETSPSPLGFCVPPPL